MILPRGILRATLCLLLVAGCAPFSWQSGPHSATPPKSLVGAKLPDETQSGKPTPANSTTTVGPPEVPAVTFSNKGRPYVDLQVHTHGTLGGDFDVDVSPDGKLIAFSSTRHSTKSNVYIQRVESGGPVEKTRSGYRDIQPKFSPDGRWIAYASDREGNYDIWIIPVEGSAAPWHLTRSDSDEIHPTWSPDGRSIAYCAREASGEWYLWRIDVNTHKRTQIGPGLYPEWSPDGQYFAFQRPSGRGQGWYGIWMVSVDGGAPEEVVTEETWGTIQPSWSPNSRSLVYGTARSPIESPDAPPSADDLWIVNLDGRRVQLTTSLGPDYAPAWGLDGRIYFTSDRSGSPRIVSLKPGSFEPPAKLGNRSLPNRDERRP